MKNLIAMEFDIVDYLGKLKNELKALDSFEFCRVSDVKLMEEVLQSYKRASSFFVVLDNQDGILFQGDGAGWFERRPVTIFLLSKLGKWPDMDGRGRSLYIVRLLYKSIVSRLIRDAEMLESLQYLNVENIPFDEVPGDFCGGMAGLFFTFTIDIPVSLAYDETEWR